MQKYIIQACLFLSMFLMVTNSYAQNDKVVLPVSGACGMCQERIETTAKNVVGVVNAKYDLEKQSLTVETQNIFQKSDLVNALLAVGHDADGKKASDDIYDNLHSCCKYRDEVHTEDDGHEHSESDGHDHDDHEGHDHSEHDGHDHGAADKTLKGVVFEKLESGAMQPIIGANIVWLGETGGTVSDMKGNFDIPFSKKSKSLIVSYVGYSPDTLVVEKPGFVNIVISAPNLLDAVTITSKKRTTEISYIETVKVHNISSKELLKAACCNLAESFDTTPAVDASMTDAITGTRKIEMLGLAGPYVQITRENIPDATFGERNVIVKCVYRFSQYQSASLAFYQKRYALEPNVEVSIISMPKELSNDSLMELESFLGRIAIDIKLVQRWLHDCGFVYKVTMADLYKQFK